MDGLVIQAEVEDGVHHAWHGVASARANSDEEGHAFGVAKFAAHDFFHLGDAKFHLPLKLDGIGALVCVVVSADLGADGEAWRHWEADAAHLGKVCTFASEEGLHGAIAVCFCCAKTVNVFDCGVTACGGFICHTVIRSWLLTDVMFSDRVLLVGFGSTDL